jgi:amidohydrolase
VSRSSESGAPTGAAPRWAEEVASWAATHQDDLIAFRRHLHAHPELSGAEHDTTDLVVERLTAAGHRPHVLDSGTGVVCDVGAPGAMPAVALRADIDGLAMPDEKEVTYRSQNAGAAHACGHDVHTTVVLGAGLALADRLEVAGASVRLIFEPAEEQVPGGAVEVIDAGWLEGVRAVYGLHCDPKLDVGTVGTRVGPITSAADQVFVVLRGPGGHTARPQLTVDLVKVAARFAIELPDLLEEIAPGEVLLVWGSLRAGDASNVIPTTAHLGGTLRTSDRLVWEQAHALLTEASTRLLAPAGVEFEVDHRRGVPPVDNHRRETELLDAAIAASLGEDARVDTPRSAGADSFAWYLERTGGTYLRLGTHDPDSPRRFDLHVGDFDVDERAIALGVRVLAAAIAAELALP